MHSDKNSVFEKRAVKVMHRIFVACLTLLLSASVNASSCTGLRDTFFVECKQEACSISFRAREISSFGICNRGLLIESVDVETSQLIISRIPDKKSSPFWEITLSHRFYGNQPQNANELRQALNENGFRASRFFFQQLPASTDLKLVRQDYETKAHTKKLELLRFWVFEIGILGVGLFILWKTARLFYKRLTGVQTGGLLIPIAIQCAIFVIALVLPFLPTSPEFFSIIAVLILLVWVCELSVYLRTRWNARR